MAELTDQLANWSALLVYLRLSHAHVGVTRYVTGLCVCVYVCVCVCVCVLAGDIILVCQCVPANQKVAGSIPAQDTMVLLLFP